MAFIHGKNTVITVNSVNLSTFTKSSDISSSADEHDTTHYGVDDKEFQAGLREATFSMEGTYDNAGATAPRDTFTGLLGADAFAVLRQPEGVGTGLAQDSFNAILTSYDESSPTDDMVTWSAEMRITGAITRTAQA